MFATGLVVVWACRPMFPSCLLRFNKLVDGNVQRLHRSYACEWFTNSSSDAIYLDPNSTASRCSPLRKQVDQVHDPKSGGEGGDEGCRSP